VSGDGTWKKREFSSHYGITTFIGYYSGKVTDLVIKGSFYQSCLYWKSKKSKNEFEEWFQEHQAQCAANHEGSVGKMEVDAVRKMFSRSEEMYGVKYGNYIDDEDSKTLKAILDLNPGDDLKVKKSECEGHVKKRMGSRLRN